MRTEFYDNVMDLIFLSPSSIKILQDLIYKFRKLHLLPFMHTQNFRHTVNIDITNSAGFGHNALISLGGEDRSSCQVLSPSIEEYLENHMQKLKSDWYFNGRGWLEAFPKYPTRPNAFGSETTTNGITIEAVGIYIHVFSYFETDPAYLFAY